MMRKQQFNLTMIFAILRNYAGYKMYSSLMSIRKLLLCVKNATIQTSRWSITKKAALVAALFLSGCVSVRTVDIITVNASDNKVATDNTVKPVNNKLKSVCDALRQRLGDNAKLPPSC